MLENKQRETKYPKQQSHFQLDKQPSINVNDPYANTFSQCQFDSIQQLDGTDAGNQGNNTENRVEVCKFKILRTIKELREKQDEKRESSEEIHSVSKVRRHKQGQTKILCCFSNIATEKYLLNSFTLRVIDTKVRDYLDNQLVFWNICLLNTAILAAPLLINLSQLKENQSATKALTGDAWIAYLFIHQLNPKNNLTLSILICFSLYAIVNLAISLIRYSKIYKERVASFKFSQQSACQIIFGKYNWRINSASQQTQFQESISATTKRILYSEPLSTSPKVDFIINVLISIVILGSFLAILILDYSLFHKLLANKEESQPFMTIFLVACIILLANETIARLVSLLARKYWRQPSSASSSFKIYLEAVAQYLLVNITIFCYIGMHTWGYLSLGQSSSSFYLNLVKKDTKSFQCYQQQTGYQIAALYLASIALQFLKLLITGVFKKMKNKYLPETVSKLQQQLILQCLSFFSFFTFAIASVAQIILFFIEWLVLTRRPSSLSESSRRIRTFFSYFQAINSILVLLFVGLILSLKADSLEYFTDDSTRLCGPFGSISPGIFFENYLVQYSIIGSIIEILTWQPLLICLIVILIWSLIPLVNRSDAWEDKLRRKQTEFAALKASYSQQIELQSQSIEVIKTQVLYFLSKSSSADNNYLKAAASAAPSSTTLHIDNQQQNDNISSNMTSSFANNQNVTNTGSVRPGSSATAVSGVQKQKQDEPHAAIHTQGIGNYDLFQTVTSNQNNSDSNSRDHIANYPSNKTKSMFIQFK